MFPMAKMNGIEWITNKRKIPTIPVDKGGMNKKAFQAWKLWRL